MGKNTEDTCPVCNGTGKFAQPKKMEIDSTEVKEKLALGLIDKGYSYRQVQVALGYKSVRSISYIIEKSKK
jgi:hypothetical protein